MKKAFKRFKGNNIIWIIFLVLALYIFLSGLLEAVFLKLVFSRKWSPAMTFILDNYAYTIVSVVVLVVVCLIIKKNRFILRSFLPKGWGKDHKVLVVEDTYEPTQNNTLRNLMYGFLLGFITNFTCIACAIAHGDIKLYYDFSASQIPMLLFGFLMVFVQSSSEELWCRGYMYERINIHYPLWVAVAVNGVLFGLLHSFNDGASVIGIIDIAVCGISYSLVRWYTGSIWTAMGIHTLWNFTQNFLFGLPNSGMVSEFSVFHLDAANGVSNLIYDYAFGVEGTIIAVLVDAALGIAVLLLAKKSGRLGELMLSYEKKAEIAAKKAEIAANDAAGSVVE